MTDVTTVALWAKTITRNHSKLMYDRRYALRADGVVLTRLDLFKGRRDLANLTTEGWQLLKRKRAQPQLQDEIKAIDKQLLPKGYKRLF